MGFDISSSKRLDIFRPRTSDIFVGSYKVIFTTGLASARRKKRPGGYRYCNDEVLFKESMLTIFY